MNNIDLNEKIKIKKLENIVVPNGVNVFIVKNPLYGGVFLKPCECSHKFVKHWNLSKYPTILIPKNCSQALLLHELGHFFAYKNKKLLDDAKEELIADKLGKKYYKYLTGKLIKIRKYGKIV